MVAQKKYKEAHDTAVVEANLAQQLEKEIFKTLPEKACVERMLEISNRVNSVEANKRLNSLKSQCKQ